MAHTKRADLGGGSPRLATRLHSEQSVLLSITPAVIAFYCSSAAPRAPDGAPIGRYELFDFQLKRKEHEVGDPC